MEDEMRLASIAVASLLLGGSAWAASGDPLIVTADGVNVRFGPGLNERVQLQVYEGQAATELERVGEWVRVEIAGTGRAGWIHQSLLAPLPVGQAARAEAEPTAEAPAVPPDAPLPPPEVSRPAPLPEAAPPREAPPEAAQAARSEPLVPPVAAPAPEPRPDRAALEPLQVEPAAAPLAGDLAGLAQFRESVTYLNSRAVAVGGVDLFTGVEPLGGGTVQVATTDAWTTVPPAGQESYVNTLVDRWAAARGGEGAARVQIVDPSGAVVMERTRP
jgi:hypothetical protein